MPRSRHAALGASWAERRQLDVLPLDYALAGVATLPHPGVRWWWGERTIDGSASAYCYLCDVPIVTWARAYPITRAAQEAILAHRDTVHGGSSADHGIEAVGSVPAAVREQENRT